MDLGDVDDLVVGLVAGSLIDQIRARSRTLLIAATVIGAIAIVGIAALPTFGRVVCALALLVAIAAAVFTFLARKAIIALLDQGVDRGELASHREALDRAVEELDVPSGPISMARLAWRLRRGTGDEVERIKGIAQRLQRELELPSDEPPTA